MKLKAIKLNINHKRNDKKLVIKRHKQSIILLALKRINFRRKYLLLFALSILILTVALGLLTKLLKISAVECYSSQEICNQYILDDIDRVENKTNYILYKNDLEKALSKNEFVRSSDIKYLFFNKVRVEVVVKSAVVALSSDDYDSYSEVDKDGLVLSIVGSTSLPVLKIDNKLPSVGEKIDERLFFATQILYSLKNHSIVSAEIKDDYIAVVQESGIKTIFPSNGEKELLLGSFVLITSRLKEGDQTSRIDTGKPVSEIDLRFKNPILR